MATRCEVYRLGLIEYERAWRLQARLAEEIGRGQRPPALLLLEHPPTYTFGRRGQEQNLLWDEETRRERGVRVYWVDRGGDVTYHGPGQLVGYPLLPLAPGGLRTDLVQGKPRLPQADYVGYLRRLEQALIQTLAAFGVVGRQIAGLTGVWVSPPAASQPEPAKIAALGVKVDVRGVSRHGFALNVAPDMTYWEGIIGCGLENQRVTSLADIVDPPPTVERVGQELIQAFDEVLGYRMQPRPADLAALESTLI